MKIQLSHKFEEIISIDNLLLAWQEFICGKRNKSDVQIFARDLMDNILALHESLVNKTYAHGGYESFYVNDPKRRHIHKASVRDRLVHHAIYRILYPFFDRTFIGDSYSCRDNKGTHKAINRFRAAAYQISKNHTKTCWVLKCDIKQFFASIDHAVLLGILKDYIPDKDILWLLGNIIGSFGMGVDCHPELVSGSIFETPMDSSASLRSGRNDRGGVGLPLGNLTSQLFANIYMNVFDTWVKHRLHVETHCNASLPYIRYADDFIFLEGDRAYLESIIPIIRNFLVERLRLTLHPKKIFLKTLASGVDFLGLINFRNYRILRNKTRRRMFYRIKENPTPETLQSYLGMLKHGNNVKTREEILDYRWLWQ